MPILNSEDENSDEYESESESEEEDVGKIMKPVFVRKENRLTIIEKRQREEDEINSENKKMVKALDRKNQTVAMVAEAIKKNEDTSDNHVNDNDSDAGLPDDTDANDRELEFEAWKVREMARLTRDAEEREVAFKEKEELLRRRNMTDEERLEDDKKNGRISDEPVEKVKWNFMQKYYHKGAFYMDEASLRNDKDVRNKDYAQMPTLEDHVDKERLPQIMQVKNFGKKGRTKYTHLLDQDTTVRDKQRVDVRLQDRVMDKYLAKRSGVGKL